MPNLWIYGLAVSVDVLLSVLIAFWDFAFQALSSIFFWSAILRSGTKINIVCTIKSKLAPMMWAVERVHDWFDSPTMLFSSIHRPNGTQSQPKRNVWSIRCWMSIQLVGSARVTHWNIHGFAWVMAKKISRRCLVRSLNKRGEGKFRL